MAGHSKWANIKHRKAAQDSKRSKVFTKILKKLSSAARRGGGDVDTNAELRLHVQKARAANVPADTIKRAILKATGQLEGVCYEDFSYEGYGPGGVAIMLEGTTDNRNRTVANVRHAFTKTGGNLGENGCVAWMFQTQGIVSLAAELVSDEDKLFELATENGADDLEGDSDAVTITCPPEAFVTLREALEEAGYTEFLTDEITKTAETSVSPSIEDAKKTMRLLDLLEDDDDIENVYSNFEPSEEVVAALT